MSKQETEELTRVHIWLYARDVERLNVLFNKNIGFSKAVRQIVRKFLDNVEDRASKGAKHLGVSHDDANTIDSAQ